MTKNFLENGKHDEKPFLAGGPAATATKGAAPGAGAGDRASKGAPLRQVLASLAANLGTVNTGMIFGFSAVALPQLKRPDSLVPITKDQASWIASLSSASTPVGCLLSGYLMDHIGRKLTLILTEIPLVLGWLLIAFATNVPMIYAGRLMVGLGSGMVGAPARVYTCEVTQPHLRGMLGALASVGVSLGVLLQYVIGAFASWNLMAGLSAMIPISALLLMLVMPESPNYLLSRDESGAQRALLRLRGSTCNVDSEMRQMILFKQKNHVEPLRGLKATLRAIVAPSTLKPFGILALYFFMYQWSGVNTITFYAVEVFELTGVAQYSNILTIALGVVRLCFTMVGCGLCRRVGRRPLTFVSGFGCGACMVVFGLCLYLMPEIHPDSLHATTTALPLTGLAANATASTHNMTASLLEGLSTAANVTGAAHPDMPKVRVPLYLSIISVACIFIYTIVCTLGYLIIPWVMIGEVYPTQVRGIAGGMTTMAAHMSVFSVVKTYTKLKDTIQPYGAFTMYGCISLFGCIFFYFYLPETKGRTLQEIEDYFCGRTKYMGGPRASLIKNNLNADTTTKTDKV